MPRGSRPGEHRGGRKPGTPNKATRDIRELAQVHSTEAVKELAKLAGLVKGTKGAESDQARIAALKELLDRGHGKATQAVDLNLQQPDIDSLTDAELARIAAGGIVTRANETTKAN
jgi:ABC-type phosphate transport system substrate-binding protein